MVEIGTTVPKPVLHTHLMKDSIEYWTRYWTSPASCHQVRTEWLYQLIQNLIDKTFEVEIIQDWGPLLDWITAFLVNRKQRVVVNDSHSCWSDVYSGIPQGSVLGPILLSLYINNLPKALQNQVLMFADDTKLFHRLQRNNMQYLWYVLSICSRTSTVWLNSQMNGNYHLMFPNVSPFILVDLTPITFIEYKTGLWTRLQRKKT